MPIVISGFAGVGKSHLSTSSLNCIDLDSSKFDKTNFPANYIDHIRKLMMDKSIGYILVSSHASVRTALVASYIPFTLVYPSITLKDEYLARYKERGSPREFIDLIDRNWSSFITDCADQNVCQRIILKKGQYLADILP